MLAMDDEANCPELDETCFSLSYGRAPVLLQRGGRACVVGAEELENRVRAREGGRPGFIGGLWRHQGGLWRHHDRIYRAVAMTIHDRDSLWVRGVVRLEEGGVTWWEPEAAVSRARTAWTDSVTALVQAAETSALKKRKERGKARGRPVRLRLRVCT
jgi:hypothetical protein